MYVFRNSPLYETRNKVTLVKWLPYMYKHLNFNTFIVTALNIKRLIQVSDMKKSTLRRAIPR